MNLPPDLFTFSIWIKGNEFTKHFKPNLVFVQFGKRDRFTNGLTAHCKAKHYECRQRYGTIVNVMYNSTEWWHFIVAAVERKSGPDCYYFFKSKATLEEPIFPFPHGRLIQSSQHHSLLTWETSQPSYSIIPLYWL